MFTKNEHAKLVNIFVLCNKGELPFTPTLLKLRSEAILEVEFLNDVFHFVGSIYNAEDVHVFGGDVAKLVQEDFLDPGYQATPELGTHQDNRERLYLGGLYQRNGFEKFVHSTKASRENNKGLGVTDKHHLAGKKVVEV